MTARLLFPPSAPSARRERRDEPSIRADERPHLRGEGERCPSSPHDSIAWKFGITAGEVRSCGRPCRRDGRQECDRGHDDQPAVEQARTHPARADLVRGCAVSILSHTTAFLLAHCSAHSVEAPRLSEGTEGRLTTVILAAATSGASLVPPPRMTLGRPPAVDVLRTVVVHAVLRPEAELRIVLMPDPGQVSASDDPRRYLAPTASRTPGHLTFEGDHESTFFDQCEACGATTPRQEPPRRHSCHRTRAPVRALSGFGSHHAHTSGRRMGFTQNDRRRSRIPARSTAAHRRFHLAVCRATRDHQLRRKCG
jgi:hypothetical protein